MDCLTESIRRTALEAGADLVGFAPISRFDQAPAPLHPRTVFPPVRTVIAIALRQPRGALKAVEEGAYWQAYNCDSYWYLNEVLAPQVLRGIVRFVADVSVDGTPRGVSVEPRSQRRGLPHQRRHRPRLRPVDRAPR